MGNNYMGYRTIHIDEAQQQEIIEFDILYRVNAQKNGEASVLLDRANAWLEPKFSEMTAAGYLEINERDNYALSEKGKQRLSQFGAMFKRFKDLSIFKCVYPEAPGPENEGDVDERFGAYHEEAQPPYSEDYRVAIFENFCQREGRKAPLHLFAFFSMIENIRPSQSEEDWIWALSSGELFDRIQAALESQPNAASICPDGWTENDIIDEIYRAGMKEMKRCFENDRDKMDPDALANDQEDFWIEEVIEDDPRHYDQREPMVYYEPYYDNRVSVGSALCVGAFAGLATCAILS